MVAMGSKLDSLVAPRYSYAEAGRLADLSSASVRRWVGGYSYLHAGQIVQRPPVAKEPSDAHAVSFVDLVELVAISRLKDEGFSLRSIRVIADNCREMFEVDRPLASLRFKTDGREIFVESDGELVEVGRRKRERAWNEVLTPFLDTLEYDEALALASRWWPLGRDAAVIVDPQFGFGLPVVEGSGVRTETLIEQFKAGDLPDQIARDFSLSREVVDRAIQFEVQRAA